MKQIGEQQAQESYSIQCLYIYILGCFEIFVEPKFEYYLEFAMEVVFQSKKLRSALSNDSTLQFMADNVH